MSARECSSRRELARELKGLGFEVRAEGLDGASARLREVQGRGGAITRRTLRLIASGAGLRRTG